MLLLAVVVAVAVPRALRPSPHRQVEVAARALARDLEQVRMKAIATKRQVRVRFYAGERFYTAFLDITPDRSGTISESSGEVRESGLQARGGRGGLPGVLLPDGVKYDVGSVSEGPEGIPASDPIDLPNDMIELNARGLVVPPSTGGVVYLAHENDPSAVAVVTLSGAGAFQSWRDIDGRWVQ